LLAGDAETGITIMQMDAGLDTGPMLLAEALAIDATDTAGTLHDRLGALGARLVVRALGQLAAGALVPRPQPAQGVTYAEKIDKREARLDWRRTSAELWRRVRAFDPAPGAVARLRGQDVKLWRAVPVAGTGTPGAVLQASDAGIDVACGTGALRLLELQRSGGKRLGVDAFRRGFAVAAGECFDPPSRD
jgi:methionyl-tRNA formyltransferase